MADHGGKETPIDVPSVLGRLAQAARYVVSSVKPTTWMGPNQPLAPAVPETAGRQFDYPVGVNLQIQPRAYESTSFWQLRELSNGYDLLRLLIETRKDQMVKIRWAIKPIDPDQKVEGDSRIAELQNLFRVPDGINPWQRWLRMLLEEMLVTDAATVYPRMTRGGGLFSLELMDGATIKRVIGDDGRTPLPPDPAYQQILKGIPTSDYTADQLIYLPRNTRVYKLYGYSPVEQIIMTVNIALRRQIHQLQYYTEGNLPDLLMSVPATWTEEQLKRLSRIWEARLNGNTAQRRQAMFVPDGTKPYDIKEAALKDEYDEWLARVCCFAFSISPQPFIKMVNRGNQESAQEAALNEGLLPIMQWVKDLMDVVIWKYKGWMDLEFGWEEEEAQDPTVTATIQKMKVDSGIISIDEARLDDGRDPIGMPNAVMTPTGPVLLKPFIDGEADGLPQEPVAVDPDKPTDDGNTPPPAAEAGANSPHAEQKPKTTSSGKSGTTDADAAAATQKPSTQEDTIKVSPNGSVQTSSAHQHSHANLEKKKSLKGTDPDSKQARDGAEAMQPVLAKFLADQAPKIAKQLTDKLTLGKAADSDDLKAKRANAAVDALDFSDWTNLPPLLQGAIVTVAVAGGSSALDQLGLFDDTTKQLMTQNATAWASDRAAEMVGMKWVDDELVPNPNAEWQITEGTRSMIRSLTVQAESEGWGADEFSNALQDSTAFSDSRAEMIARTESAKADVHGNIQGWKASGVVESKQFLAAPDCCDECQELDGEVVGLDDTFSDGSDGAPLHPNCRCNVLPVLSDESTESADGGE